MAIIDSSQRMVEAAKALQNSIQELQKLLNAGEEPNSETIALVDSAFPVLRDVRRELIGGKAAWNEWVGQCHEDGCLYVVIEFGIPKLVPIDGAVAITELAAKSGLSQDKLQRMLRLLATTGIFKETEAGWTHTLMSKALVDQNTHSYCSLALEEGTKVRSNIVDYLRDPNAANMGPWEYTYGKPMYDYFVQNKTRAENFAKGMEGLTTAERDPRLLLEFFRSEGIETAKIVDVGGGSGHVMKSLAPHFPGFKYVIQDQNEAMFAETRKKLTGSSFDFEFQVHNFFEEQPVRDADYFFVRQIFHNWADDKCRQILRCLIPAMKEHTSKSGKKCKLLINDSIVPRPGTVDSEVERRHRQMDLCMFYVLGALERDQEQWKELVEDFNDDIKISRFIESTDSGDIGLVVIELV